jgi:hypothetical protein
MKNIYEIKTSKFNWQYVLADSIHAVDAYCKANGLKDWRTVGMMSRDEIAHIRATAKAI